MNKQLASLLFYNETLYVNPEEKTPQDKTAKFTTDKHVLVLTKPLNENQTVFLNKILTAAKLSLNTIDLTNKSIELSNLTALGSVKYIIAFGELIEKNTISIQKYKPVLLDGKTFIFADSVTDVAKNANQEKVGLWNALKETFLL